jgi:phenylacetate-CoA ligase
MLYRLGRGFFSRHPHLMMGPIGSVARRIPISIRHGREYRRIRRLLAESQWWSRERLDAYQLEQLQWTLAKANEVSPHYREAFAAAGVKPADLRSLDDIRRFPLLEKQDLRENLGRMINPKIPRSRTMDFCTGGTTGPGVVIPFEESYRNRCRGFVWHMWEQIGYRPDMLGVILQHREVPEDINEGIWYMEKPSNAMVLSSHRLTPRTIHKYLEAIEQHRPRVLIAYPSLAYLFAIYAKQAGLKGHVFDLVILSSETLYEFQRTELERVFQAKTRIHYAHIESAAMLSYCDHTNLYHVQPEYGFVEILKDDGSPAGPGEVGEIVATNFENRLLPLVRYRTGDLAEASDARCECGRNYSIVERIHGRRADLIRSPSGTGHSPIVVEVLMDQALLAGRDHFSDLQIVQTKLDEIVVRVVPSPDFRQEDVDWFCDLLDEALHHEIRITSERVSAIPRTDRQKKCLVVSEIPES